MTVRATNNSVYQNDGTEINITAGAAIQIKDSNGNVIYSTTAVKNANHIVFASDSLDENETYYLYLNNELAASTNGSADSNSSTDESSNDSSSSTTDESSSTESSSEESSSSDDSFETESESSSDSSSTSNDSSSDESAAKEASSSSPATGSMADKVGMGISLIAIIALLRKHKK